MKILLNIFYFVVVFSFTQAKESTEPAELCKTNDMLAKGHLSCLVCGLRKLNRPEPDQNFLAAMGLAVREKAAFFDEEQNKVAKYAIRKPLSSKAGTIKKTTNGAEVLFTPSMQYQKALIQMILSTGYCTSGKIKSKSSKTNYENFMKRIDSSSYPEADKKETKAHELAVKEVGFNDWDNLIEDLWPLERDKQFFSASYQKQKEIAAMKKKKIVNSGPRGEAFSKPDSDIYDCFQDIDNNYSKDYFSPQKAFEACEAMYNECGIATTPIDDETGKGGDMYRKDVNGNKVRVGGEWCKDKYLTTTVTRSDGTPKGPAEDKSQRSIGGGLTMSTDGSTIFDGNGRMAPTSKAHQDYNGIWTVPPDAWEPIKSGGYSKKPEGVPPK